MNSRNSMLLWTVMVGGSAILSLYYGFSVSNQSLNFTLGMILGILTFIIFYYYFDKWLVAHGWQSFRKALLIAIGIKMAMQLAGLPADDPITNIMTPEFIVGVYAYHFTQLILQSIDTSLASTEWIFAYLTTLATGAGLSLLVLLLTGLLMLFFKNKTLKTTLST